MLTRNHVLISTNTDKKEMLFEGILYKNSERLDALSDSNLKWLTVVLPSHHHVLLMALLLMP